MSSNVFIIQMIMLKVEQFPENNVNFFAKETKIVGAVCRIVVALVNGMQLTDVKNCPIQ